MIVNAVNELDNNLYKEPVMIRFVSSILGPNFVDQDATNR
jgi:hypothetical protein